MTAGPLSTSITIEAGGEELQLLPGRGVFAPARQALLVADAHFGKADIFSNAGIPVPVGATLATLGRIDAMLAATSAHTLIMLGDVWHGQVSPSDAAVHAVAAWRARHTQLSVEIVRGNHDRHTAAHQNFDAEYHDRHGDLGALRLQHFPEPVADRFVIAGHVHPVITLRETSRSHMRLPCFHQQGNVLTLPAVGAFTGGQPIRPLPGDRVFVCADDRLVALPVG